MTVKNDGKPNAVKVARSVLSGGQPRDNIKGLGIAKLY